MIKKEIILFVLFGLVMSACLKDKTPSPTSEFVCADTVFFNAVIQAEIMNVSCNVVGCHSAVSGAAGYALTTHDQISNNAEILLKVMQHKGSVKPMPIGAPKLADSLIKKFECWIEQGKLNN